MNALSLWRLSRDSVLLPQPTLSSPGVHSPGKAAATPLIPGQAAGHRSPSLPGPPGGQSLSRPWHDAAGPGYSARRGPVGRAGGRPQIRHGWGKLSGFIQGVPRQKCSRVHCRSSSPLALQPPSFAGQRPVLPFTGSPRAQGAAGLLGQLPDELERQRWGRGGGRPTPSQAPSRICPGKEKRRRSPV